MIRPLRRQMPKIKLGPVTAHSTWARSVTISPPPNVQYSMKTGPILSYRHPFSTPYSLWNNTDQQVHGSRTSYRRKISQGKTHAYISQMSRRGKSQIRRIIDHSICPHDLNSSIRPLCLRSRICSQCLRGRITDQTWHSRTTHRRASWKHRDPWKTHDQKSH